MFSFISYVFILKWAQNENECEARERQRGEDKAKCCWKFRSRKRSRANLKGKRRDYNDKKRRDHYTNDSLNDSYEWIVLNYLICPLTIIKMPLAFLCVREKCWEQRQFEIRSSEEIKRNINIKAKKLLHIFSPWIFLLPLDEKENWCTIINIIQTEEERERKHTQESRHKSSFRSLIDVKNEISLLICLRNGNPKGKGRSWI
jgi:hypothetical protein